MSQINDLRELAGEIDRHDEVITRLFAALDTLVERDIPGIGENTTTGLAAAGLLENLYTATETVLVRIAQQFGNNLRSDRWHSDLLRRMAIAIPGLRPAVISQEVYQRLDELMRFRHFKRYYFNLEYNWQRLYYLIDLVRALRPALAADFAAFRAFVFDAIQALEAKQ